MITQEATILEHARSLRVVNKFLLHWDTWSSKTVRPRIKRCTRRRYTKSGSNGNRVEWLVVHLYCKHGDAHWQTCIIQEKTWNGEGLFRNVVCLCGPDGHGELCVFIVGYENSRTTIYWRNILYSMFSTEICESDLPELDVSFLLKRYKRSSGWVLLTETFCNHDDKPTQSAIPTPNQRNASDEHGTCPALQRVTWWVT